MREDIKERIEKIKRGEVPEGYKKTKLGIIPEDWDIMQIKDCLERVDNPVDVMPEEEYVQIGIRSHGKGLFYKEAVKGKELGNKRVFWIEPDCFIVNVVFAWEQAVGKTTAKELGMIASHRFPMYKIVGNKFDLDFLCDFFKTRRGIKIMEFASPGGAGRNRTLGQDRFVKSQIIVPQIKEQKIIKEILELYNLKIKLLTELIEKKKYLQESLIRKIVTGKYRVPGFESKFSKTELRKIFDYIQPTDYIVKSTEYSDDYEIPVLTAGKSFVLGYTDEKEGIYSELPVVIFDDFTTNIKYVDFPFKVKSSAMKILRCKKEYNIIFIYYAMQINNYKVVGHERQWISKYSLLEIKHPSLEEQNQIAKILKVMRKEIILLEKKLEQMYLEKKAMMQLLLTGIVRVNDH